MMQRILGALYQGHALTLSQTTPAFYVSVQCKPFENTVEKGETLSQTTTAFYVSAV